MTDRRQPKDGLILENAMRLDLTDITVVMDRSGSMQSCRTDAEGGLNAFIAKQKDQPGEAIFTLVQFNTTYEFVHTSVPIKQVPPCKLEPSGGTALLDAVGRAISETGSRLSAMVESDRPGLVVIVIVTDGEENSSREFTLAKVKEMIEHQQTNYKWQFIYLGANQDAFAEAGNMGINLQNVANYWTHNTRAAHGATADLVSRMRLQSYTGQSVTSSYTDEEREDMK